MKSNNPFDMVDYYNVINSASEIYIQNSPIQ
jgi:hypothetical protein